jgi:AraC-like DNA-binding protein
MVAIFDYRQPCPALREHVRLLQIVGCEFPSSMTVLPSKAYWPRAENCLSFFPRDLEKIEYGFDGNPLKSPRSRIYGQHSIATTRHVGRDFMVFQVVFQPGALFRLTGIPSYELANTIVDAEAVFATDIRLVSERLSNCRHYTEMIPIVEDFLLLLVARRPAHRIKNGQMPIDKVSRFMIQNPTNVSLDWLANQACLSQRQFYRQFVEREGVSPKLYARIARFENVMKFKNAQPHLDWLRIALENGYYDYQHLVRDFKEFTHLTPTEFSEADGKSPERVFGVSET